MKVNILKHKTDRQSETNGVPFFWNGATFFVRRKNAHGKHNELFNKALQEFLLSHPDLNSLKDGILDSFIADITAKYLIAGWEDVIDEETNEHLDFSVELCSDILKQIPDLATDIQNFATNRSNFIKNAEHIKKN